MTNEQYRAAMELQRQQIEFMQRQAALATSRAAPTAPPPPAPAPAPRLVNKAADLQKIARDAIKSTPLLVDESLGAQREDLARKAAAGEGESIFDKIGKLIPDLSGVQLNLGGGGSAQPLSITSTGQPQGGGFDPMLILLLGGLGLAAVLLAGR
jgi:hypothetical protein